MQLEKRIFEDLTSLKEYFIDKGFVISNGEMRWGAANQDSNCHWSIDDTEETINFVDSDGNNAFPYSLADFSEGRVTGVVFLPLKDNGFAMNITPMNEGVGTANLTLSCLPGTYIQNVNLDSFNTINPNSLQNGLIICTPAEEDEYWRYSWRSMSFTPKRANGGNYYYPMSPSFKWTIDNCRHNVLSGQEIPSVQRYDVSNSLTLTKVFLADGFWSNYIYMQVLGSNQNPGTVFKINGQKFISFCDLSTIEKDGDSSEAVGPTGIRLYRNPCFLMADEDITINNSSSTEAYSRLKTYQVGDYCIFNDKLYKCIVAITQPEAFDETHWLVTTVTQEMLNA